MSARRPAKRAVLAVLVAILLIPIACNRSGAGIKVVIADYSKDHTKPFWSALAETYTKQTGTKVVFAFTADLAGTFELEAHDNEQVVLVLEVV